MHGEVADQCAVGREHAVSFRCEPFIGFRAAQMLAPILAVFSLQVCMDDVMRNADPFEMHCISARKMLCLRDACEVRRGT